MSCQIQPVAAAAELQKGKGEEEEGTIEEINELSSCKFLLATPANHTVDAPNNTVVNGYRMSLTRNACQRLICHQFFWPKISTAAAVLLDSSSVNRVITALLRCFDGQFIDVGAFYMAAAAVRKWSKKGWLLTRLLSEIVVKDYCVFFFPSST